MSEGWRKGLLFVAAAWNLLGGASALLDPPRHFAQLYTGSLTLTDPIALFFYRCTWINAMAWGAAYALVALWPAGRVPVLLAGAGGKLAYAGACVAVVTGGAGKSALLLAGAVDVVLAAGFLLVVLLRPNPKRS
jgi:hypothetical protein